MINLNNFDENDQEQIILNGLYQHYKGDIYSIYGTAINSENKRKTVIYQCCKSGKLWTRDFEEFTGYLEIDGETKKRFELYGFEDASIFIED
jgi:hypothetical protein